VDDARREVERAKASILDHAARVDGVLPPPRTLAWIAAAGAGLGVALMVLRPRGKAAPQARGSGLASLAARLALPLAMSLAQSFFRRASGT
jgi:hypothetical protein